MKQRIKQYLLMALAAAAVYFLMANHFVFHGRHVYFLEKSNLNLHYTFVSLNNYKPEALLKIDSLREAGIGDLLVELGMMTEENKDLLESKYNDE